MPFQIPQMKMWDTPSLSGKPGGHSSLTWSIFVLSSSSPSLTVMMSADLLFSSESWNCFHYNRSMWLHNLCSLFPIDTATKQISPRHLMPLNFRSKTTLFSFHSCHNFMLVTHHMPISNVNKYFIDCVNLFCREWSPEWDKLFTYQFYDLGKSLRASKFISFIWKMELKVNRVAVKGKWVRILKHCMASIESFCYFCFHFLILLLPSYLFVKVYTINYFYRIKRGNFSVTKATMLYILKI